MRLSELKTGEKGVIVKVLGHGGFRKRIVEMGFIKGKTVEVLLNAPLKDPIKYKIMGYEISLRRQEADMIEIISEQEAKSQTQEAAYHQGLTEDIDVKEEDLKRVALGKRRTINVALVGNPNCGKTSLFNLASGAHEHVGNYSGVTVDAKEGYFDFQGYHFKIVDLPGTYSLSAYTPEEIYVRRHIIDETPDVIINVVDSSNLERNLYLTTQLIDMNVRMVVALNMYDELEASGNTLDYLLLGKLFGVPMVPTVCKRNIGVDRLFHVVINLYEGADFIDKKGHIHPEVAKEIMDWHQSLPNFKDHGEHPADYTHGKEPVGKVFRHIHINHGPDLEKAIDAVKEEISKNEFIRHKYSTRYLAIKLLENDPEIERFIHTLPNAVEVEKKRDKAARRIQETMNEDSESALTDAKYGFISGALKETFTDNHLEQEQTTKVLDSIVTHRIWGYPIFFLFMYLMFEGTFVIGEYPMMGIEWLVEALGNLIRDNMSEGPLKDLMIDGIIGGVGGVIVFLPNILILYFCISLMEDSGYMARAAFIMDKIMHKMGLHGKSFIPLIMGFGCNVPMKSIFRHTWEKGAQYLKKMGGIIMIASIIIWFLGYYPDHDAYPTQAEQQENSYIGQIGQAVEPVLKPLGFDWKLSIGLLSGVGAKELVVSTLGVLYTNDADADVVSLAERIPITPLAAFSYMLFVLIYFPCIATLVAIKQESGSWKWAIFTAGYTTALAWLVSFAVYQIGGMFL